VGAAAGVVREARASCCMMADLSNCMCVCVCVCVHEHGCAPVPFVHKTCDTRAIYVCKYGFGQPCVYTQIQRVWPYTW
jgi:hypothetical protein